MNYKKITFEDKFIRKYYCRHAKQNYLRHTKVHNRRKARRILNKEAKILDLFYI